MLYLLDTDHLSLLQRGGDDGRVIAERILPLPKDDYGASIISYVEQMRGRLDSAHRAKNDAAEVSALNLLHITLRFYSSIAVWDYTEESAQLYGRLKALKLRVGTQDMKIASIALANGATLLSRNRRDFERIPGLVVEDWTIQGEAYE